MPFNILEPSFIDTSLCSRSRDSITYLGQSYNSSEKNKLLRGLGTHSSRLKKGFWKMESLAIFVK